MLRRSLVIVLIAAMFLCGSALFAAGGKEKATVTQKKLLFYVSPNPGAPDPNTGIKTSAFLELEAEYEKLHPDVKIENVMQAWSSEQDMRTWNLTQLAAGTAPDVMQTQPHWIREDLGKGWWLPTDEFYAKPSPYNKNFKTWGESFNPNMDLWKLADGKHYHFQTTQVQTITYYNKDILKKLGLTEPKTWSELMAAAKIIKNAGYIPFAWNLSDLNQLTWLSGHLHCYTFYNRLKEFDLDGDGVINDYELALAVRKGTFKATMPEYVESLRLLMDMAPYWSPGCIGATRPTAYREWVTEQAVFLQDGTWDYFGVEKDPLRKFEYGVMYYTPLKREDSKFITRDDIPLTNKGAGYGDIFGLPALTKKRGTLDIAVDFLMWITEPRNQTRICQEQFKLPNIKGAKGPSLLDPVLPTLAYPLIWLNEEDQWLTVEYGTRFQQHFQDLYNGNLTLQQAAEKMQPDLVVAADRVLEIHDQATKK